MDYDFKTEISALASAISEKYFELDGIDDYPIEPEMIAEKFFGLQIVPVSQLYSGVGVKSGIDSTQGVLFIDEGIYMRDDLQHFARQSIAHEIGHIVFDAKSMRSSAPYTVEEAYRLHLEIGQSKKIEFRAHKFAGALLVPRRQLLVQAARLLKLGLPGIKESNPSMTMQTLVDALSASKLSKYFGVSDDVIRWRLIDEEFYSLLGVQPWTPLSEVDVDVVLDLCSIESERITPPISERVRRLIPESLLTRIERS